MAAQHVLKLAIDKAGKLAIQAKGDPAKVVAYGAAAAVVFIGAGIGYGALETARWLSGKDDKPKGELEK